MASRIRIGPTNGPYTILNENGGDLDITTPNNLVDFNSEDIDNVLFVTNVGRDEPATPDTDEMVRWYDASAGAYKAKFDDGSTVTLAQK